MRKVKRKIIKQGDRYLNPDNGGTLYIKKNDDMNDYIIWGKVPWEDEEREISLLLGWRRKEDAEKYLAKIIQDVNRGRKKKMKIALTLQYHPPTGECAYFPTTDNLKMGLALTDDAELLRLLGKVAKRIDELAKSQVVFDFDARPPAHVRDRLFAEAFKEASQ